MATTQMIFSDERARTELGYRSRSARDALTRSARWFADNGYVTEKRWLASTGSGRPRTSSLRQSCLPDSFAGSKTLRQAPKGKAGIPVERPAKSSS